MVGVGSDLAPGNVLAAYRRGIFPWPQEGEVPWYSPTPRAVFPLESPPSWSRSLRRALRGLSVEVTFDQAFPEVIAHCAMRPEGTWITPTLQQSFTELHTLGWSHSVEVWSLTPRILIGGLYGLAIGGYFSAESMFSRVSNASKCAFVSLAEALHAAQFTLLDVQVLSPHLVNLGCHDMPRHEFLQRLVQAQARPATFPT